jgi:hypothetical protein
VSVTTDSGRGVHIGMIHYGAERVSVVRVGTKEPFNWWASLDGEKFEVCGHRVYGQLMPALRSFWSMSLSSDSEDP